MTALLVSNVSLFMTVTSISYQTPGCKTYLLILNFDGSTEVDVILVEYCPYKLTTQLYNNVAVEELSPVLPLVLTWSMLSEFTVRVALPGIVTDGSEGALLTDIAAVAPPQAPRKLHKVTSMEYSTEA